MPTIFNSKATLTSTRGTLLNTDLRGNPHLHTTNTFRKKGLEIPDQKSYLLLKHLTQNQKSIPLKPKDSKDTTAIKTNPDKTTFHSTLENLYNDSLALKQEKGFNNLHICLGFIHWYEQSNEWITRKSPLLLIPVELKRTQQNFTLEYTGEEITSNLIFHKRCLEEYKLDLPNWTEDTGFLEHIGRVNKAIFPMGNWSLQPNEIFLGFFSNRDLHQYQDLAPERWEFHPQPTAPIQWSKPRKHHLYSYHPALAIDSEQVNVLHHMLSGENLIIQGPPGTGKSQTIVHCISEALVQNKKVLFVSEKIAALEVVKQRMEKAGLSDLALELHSQNALKTRFTKKLKGCLDYGSPLPHHQSIDVDDMIFQEEKIQNYFKTPGQEKDHPIYDEDNILKSFERLNHDHKEFFKRNIYTILQKHWERFSDFSNHTQFSRLQKELNKKQRIKPVRQLLNEHSRIIQELTPVFMMSPSSIGYFLEPGNFEFDLVIFDEASQIPWNTSLSALLRGKQYIVSGDPEQLPPTSYFKSKNSIANKTTVLDWAIEERFKSIQLKNHYRSHSPDLIAFSNRYIYNHSLKAIPHPPTENTFCNVQLHHSSNSVYHKQINKEEAKRVVQFLKKALKENPDYSIGIVTLSHPQRIAIQKDIAFSREFDPWLDKELIRRSHQIYIKNLEQMQGDECDIIIISIGYSYNKNGKLIQHFGSINQEGGEKRLNVLFSRARFGMHLFCNLNPDHISIDNKSSKGKEYLKDYLQHLHKNPNAFNAPQCNDPLLLKIKESLLDKGFKADIYPYENTSNLYLYIRYEINNLQHHIAIIKNINPLEPIAMQNHILEQNGWDVIRIFSQYFEQDFLHALQGLLKRIESIVLKSEEPTTSISRSTEVSGTAKKKFSNYAIYKHKEFVDPNKTFLKHDKNEIARTIGLVIKTETPIHEDIILDRLQKIYAIKKVGRNILKHYKSALEFGSHSLLFQYHNGFCYSNTFPPIIPRDRSSFPSKYKNFEFISPEEIQNGILKILTQFLQMNKADLYKQLQSQFGFHRSSNRNELFFDNALEYLLKNNQIKLLPNHSFTPI